MARKRMIDPSFWTDEKLGECCIQARLLFMGLISNADDEGYGRANPKLLKSLLFPYDDDLRASDIEKWLSQLGGLNLIALFGDAEQTYYNLPNFLRHQTINKPTKSVFPKYDSTTSIVLPYDYGSTTVALPPNRIEEKRREEKRKEKDIMADKPPQPARKFIKPSVDEVKAYCLERNNGIDSAHFVDYYDTRGWVLNNGKKMVDWKAAVRTWEKNQRSGNSGGFNRISANGNTATPKTSQKPKYGTVLD